MEPTTQTAGPIIRATNKKTGQVFQGTIEEARRFGFSDEFINKKLEASSKLESNIKIIKEGGDITAESETGKITAKDKALAEGGLAAVKQVKEVYERDPSVLAKQLIPGQFASREFDNLVYNLADTLLRLRTGAQANPAEIRGYMRKIAPFFGDSPQIVEKKLNNLQRDLALYAGKEKTEPITIKKKKGPTGVGILDFLLGGAINVAKDIGAGAGLSGAEGEATRQSQQAALDMAERARQKAATTADPEQKRRLLEVAGQGAETVGQGAGALQSLFSPDIERPYLGRGLQAGAEITSTAALTSSLLKLLQKGGASLTGKALTTGGGDVGQKVVSAAEKVRRIMPANVLGEKQAQAAAKTLGKVKPDVGKIINAGKKFAETDPDAEAILVKNIPKITNIKDIPTLLERMRVWGTKTYGPKGIKSAAKSDLYDKFYKAGTDILKNQAPEVYKQRQLLRLTFELPSAFGKALWRATLGKILVGGL